VSLEEWFGITKIMLKNYNDGVLQGYAQINSDAFAFCFLSSMAICFFSL
jgi:hypothetical protein